MGSPPSQDQAGIYTPPVASGCTRRQVTEKKNFVQAKMVCGDQHQPACFLSSLSPRLLKDQKRKHSHLGSDELRFPWSAPSSESIALVLIFSPAFDLLFILISSSVSSSSSSPSACLTATCRARGLEVPSGPRSSATQHRPRFVLLQGPWS